MYPQDLHVLPTAWQLVASHRHLWKEQGGGQVGGHKHGPTD